MIVLYGIPNCDTVKKTMKWFTARQIPYAFHDYRKEGITSAKIKNWLKQQPLEKLLNRGSATWKNLSDAEKEAASTTDGAIQLMISQPTVIKRPVIEDAGGKVLAVGFKEDEYAARWS